MAEVYPYAEMLGKVMYAIKDDPVLLMLALQDPVLAKWWDMRKKKEDDRIAKELSKAEAKKEEDRLAKIKEDLLSVLTDDQKKALGIWKDPTPEPVSTHRGKKVRSKSSSKSWEALDEYSSTVWKSLAARSKSTW